MIEGDVLRRPVWHSLCGRQAALAAAPVPADARFAGVYAVRINPHYGPFAAARDASDTALAALAGLLRGSDDQIWLVEDAAWPAPPGCRIVRTAPLLQMIATDPQAPQPGDLNPCALGDRDAMEMAALAHATEPGPWGTLTHCYGQFYGLRDGAGRLLAMAGERMLPGPNLAEVSGVCTWPDHRGRGLAGQLIRRVMADQTKRGDTPYLHSYAGNSSAIRLYESLGFVPVREMVATVLALD